MKYIRKLTLVTLQSLYNYQIHDGLHQWTELKEFFEVATASPQEKSYTARTLAEMYNDYRNILYLFFFG